MTARVKDTQIVFSFIIEATIIEATGAAAMSWIKITTTKVLHLHEQPVDAKPYYYRSLHIDIVDNFHLIYWDSD